MDEIIIILNQVIRGLINYFRIANMKRNLIEVTSHLSRRIRYIIWKQLKTCNHRYKCLLKLGVSGEKSKKDSI